MEKIGLVAFLGFPHPDDNPMEKLNLHPISSFTSYAPGKGLVVK
jgi:hypothetical protein